MFGMTDVVVFITAFIMLLALPGPGNLALLTATSKSGVRAGLAATLGVIVGDQVLLWLASGGVAAVLVRYPALFYTVQWCGAAYLAWLGWQLIGATTAKQELMQFNGGHYFRQTFFITLLNPKAIMFYMAFFPQFIDPVHHQGVITLAFMAVLVAVLTFLYGVIFCNCVKLLAEPLRNRPQVALWLQRAAGLCLVGFALRMVVQGQ